LLDGISGRGQSFVSLILSPQSFIDIVQANYRFVIVVVIVCAPERHVERDIVEVELCEILIKANDPLEPFLVDDLDDVIVKPFEAMHDLINVPFFGVHEPIRDSSLDFLCDSVSNDELVGISISD
jgi:hypothetical protein